MRTTRKQVLEVWFIRNSLLVVQTETSHDLLGYQGEDHILCRTLSIYLQA